MQYKVCCVLTKTSLPTCVRVNGSRNFSYYHQNFPSFQNKLFLSIRRLLMLRFTIRPRLSRAVNGDMFNEYPSQSSNLAEKLFEFNGLYPQYPSLKIKNFIGAQMCAWVIILAEI